MASKKQGSEMPGAFNFIGCVVYSKVGLDTKSGARRTMVVVESASQEDAQQFDIHSDYADVCRKGNWVTISYHWNKKGENVIDSYEAIDLGIGKEGASVESPNNFPLHLAITAAKRKLLGKASRDGSIHIVDALIDAKVNVDAEDPLGRAAAHQAAAAGSAACLARLIHAGCDVNKSDANGDTPASHAAAHGYIDCLTLLVDAGACIDKPNHGGRTTLMHAVAYSKPDCARFLVERGASVDGKDRKGRGVADYAAEGADQECIEIIRGALLRRSEAIALSCVTAGPISSSESKRVKRAKSI